MGLTVVSMSDFFSTLQVTYPWEDLHQFGTFEANSFTVGSAILNLGNFPVLTSQQKFGNQFPKSMERSMFYKLIIVHNLLILVSGGYEIHKCPQDSSGEASQEEEVPCGLVQEGGSQIIFCSIS